MNFISLFCGCGGFDLGFVKTGFKCKAAFDIDEIAIKNYSNYFVHKATQCDLSRNISLRGFHNIDVVLAGSPCQGFSTAGKRKYNDPRNHLLLRAVEIALTINPKVFILENVNGVVAGQHRDYWDKAQEMLKHKYQVSEICVNTEDFGLAQTRKRRLLFAWKTDKTFNFSLSRKIKRTLQHAISGIGESLPNHLPRYFDEGSQLGLIAQKIKPGQKLSNVRGGHRSVHTWHIPEVYGRTSKKERGVLEALLKLRRRNRLRDHGDADPVKANAIVRELKKPVKDILISLIKKNYVRKINDKYDLTHSFNGKYKRLRWDFPAPTVDTRFGNPRYFLHPEENRGLTVREAARIQGFPDDYVFMGTDVMQYRLVGNAVPPPISEKLGLLVRNIIA
ncbi:MAG: DNA cytosine methyltransferase [Candidatus Scalindua sp.]